MRYVRGTRYASSDWVPLLTLDTSGPTHDAPAKHRGQRNLAEQLFQSIERFRPCPSRDQIPARVEKKLAKVGGLAIGESFDGVQNNHTIAVQISISTLQVTPRTNIPQSSHHIITHQAPTSKRLRQCLLESHLRLQAHSQSFT